MNGSCVLMYHAISDQESPCDEVGSDDPVYTVRPRSFRAQLQYMSERDVTVQSLDQHLDSGEFGSGHVVMTFDDGNRSDYLTALPLLQKHGFSATFFITTQWIGQPGFVTAKDLRHLHAAGMELGSHGHTHRYFDEMSPNELTSEMVQSTAILSKIIDSPIRALGAPGGRLHPDLCAISRRCGVETISTSRFGLLTINSSRLSIPRVPVLRTTTANDFQNIVNGDRRYYRRKMIRHTILQSAKKLFGNTLYERLRTRVIRDG